MYKSQRLNIERLSQLDKLNLCKFLSVHELKFYEQPLYDIPGDGPNLITDLEVRPPGHDKYHSITLVCNPTRVKNILKRGKYLELDLYKAMLQVIPSDPYLQSLCNYEGLKDGILSICHTRVH